MEWPQAVLLGACGGAVVEIVAFSRNVDAWRTARKAARSKGRGKPPRFSAYVDPPADILAFVTRLLLGAFAGAILHAEVTGTFAAIAVGASAPAILLQFGSARSITQATQFGPSDVSPDQPARTGGPQEVQSE